MKYLINKMCYSILSQQGGCLDGKGDCLQSKYQGLSFMSGVVCGQQWYVDRISPIKFLK